ncbi:hypothetical protein C7441_11087 [Pseudaminobacter salicylatoxidans]|uniref:Uncharacterized protein n=1 Tax=Pseudaminobacter salicylatoxidans TaxID=93369 RepID=A0A316CM90_PSESE|nr:hypothetical protein [Pseudaminobacter salicylatoxidans]PWJ81555.1 hypothetical protein C7441_11087 [Pseudaminobacter salicylatoxidans]
MASRVAIAPDHGAKVFGPPEGWRPRALTTREKIEIIVRQSGREPGGARLNPLKEGVDFDHSPALQRRRWDPETQDTVPASCDLNYIVALNKATHADKTASQDVPEIAKTRRLEGKTGQNKRKRKWPSRPMQSRRKIG